MDGATCNMTHGRMHLQIVISRWPSQKGHEIMMKLNSRRSQLICHEHAVEQGRQAQHDHDRQRSCTGGRLPTGLGIVGRVTPFRYTLIAVMMLSRKLQEIA